jgi:hypothetical protein
MAQWKNDVEAGSGLPARHVALGFQVANTPSLRAFDARLLSAGDLEPVSDRGRRNVTPNLSAVACRPKASLASAKSCPGQICCPT